MQPVDYLLIAAIGVLGVLAVRRVRKNRGACGGDCASCRKSCAQRQDDRDPDAR